MFDAHDRAFAFFGGTCMRGIYDTMKIAAGAVFTGSERACNQFAIVTLTIGVTWLNFGNAKMTTALLDRLTHRTVRPAPRTGGVADLTLEMNGQSYRLSQSRAQGQTNHQIQSPQAGPDGPERLGTHQLYGKRTRQGAHPWRPSALKPE